MISFEKKTAKIRMQANSILNRLYLFVIIYSVFVRSNKLRHWNHYYKKNHPNFFIEQKSSEHWPSDDYDELNGMQELKPFDLSYVKGILTDKQNKENKPILSENRSHSNFTETDVGGKSERDLEVCKNCKKDMNNIKNFRIEQVKWKILKETGLINKPNMTNFILPKTPSFLKMVDRVNRRTLSIDYSTKRLFNSAFGDEPRIENEKSYITTSQSPKQVNIPGHQKINYFNLSNEYQSNSHVISALLHLWLNPIQKGVKIEEEKVRITIYKVVASKYKNDYHRLSSSKSKQSINYKQNGTWVEIDLFSLVRDWLKKPDENLGFVVTALTNSGLEIDVSSFCDDPPNAPLLELDVQEQKNDRTKRYANNRVCTDNKPESRCCLFPLIVDFVQLKFDFIVAPKRYVANFCKGKCIPLIDSKTPHSTLVQHMLPMSNFTYSAHGTCCGSSNMAPLKIIYFDGEIIKISLIDDMVVKACSCN